MSLEIALFLGLDDICLKNRILKYKNAQVIYTDVFVVHWLGPQTVLKEIKIPFWIKTWWKVYLSNLLKTSVKKPIKMNEKTMFTDKCV